MKVRISDHKIPIEIKDIPSKLQNTYTDIEILNQKTFSNQFSKLKIQNTDIIALKGKE